MSDWLTKAIPAIYRFSGASRVLSHPFADGLFLALFFAYKRLIEDPFAALTRRQPQLFDGGDILDVGANAGYTAAVFARVVSPGRKVHAFEPEPVNFRRLQRVIRDGKLDNIVVPHQVAVGAAEGRVDLLINPHHPGDHRVVTGDGVRMISLDGFDNVAFVKIDTQGYELEVSRGMAALIERSPTISIAFEYSGEAPELLNFYRSRGFALHTLTHDGDLVAFDDAHLAKRGYADLLARRGAKE